MKRRILIVAGAILPVLAATGIALAAGGLTGAKSATAGFHTLKQAKAAGYTVKVRDLKGYACIEDPAGAGGMGVHMLNPALLDGKIDPQKPEILIYEPQANGKVKLVALEYLVLAKDWKRQAKPKLFGKDFDTVMPGNRYGLPKAYALHAWVWKGNPSGVLEPFNPKVSCG